MKCDGIDKLFPFKKGKQSGGLNKVCKLPPMFIENAKVTVLLLLVQLGNAKRCSMYANS